MTISFEVTLWCAFVIAAALTAFLISVSGRLRIIDHPNERSLHSVPTPRSGGLAIWAGMIAGIILLTAAGDVTLETLRIFSAAMLVGLVSFMDDRAQISVRIRLVVHLVAAGILLSGGVPYPSWWPGASIMPPWWIVGLLDLFFIVWMTNLYNFMDGMDGFAGGMAVFGFGTLGTLGYLAGDAYYAAVCWVIAGSAGGFLLWNFPPARIFMGDTGSSALGLLAAALSLWADRAGLFPLWLALLVFAPFVVDATTTLIYRALLGKKVWEAHRDHCYQRLVRAGWNHRRTVLWEYGLMALCACAALVAYLSGISIQWAAVVCVLAVCSAAMVGVSRVEARSYAGGR